MPEEDVQSSAVVTAKTKPMYPVMSLSALAVVLRNVESALNWIMPNYDLPDALVNSLENEGKFKCLNNARVKYVKIVIPAQELAFLKVEFSQIIERLYLNNRVLEKSDSMVRAEIPGSLLIIESGEVAETLIRITVPKPSVIAEDFFKSIRACNGLKKYQTEETNPPRYVYHVEVDYWSEKVHFCFEAKES